MELQEYNFDISHIPGKQNQKADFLSRIVTTNIPPACHLEDNVLSFLQGELPRATPG